MIMPGPLALWVGRSYCFLAGPGVPVGYKILKDADGNIVKDSSGKIVLVRE